MSTRSLSDLGSRAGGSARMRANRPLQLLTLAITGVFVAIGIWRTQGSASALAPEPDMVRSLDELWVIVAAGMVFLMQAGFMAFEVGLARPHHAPAVALKNLVDWTAASLAFFLVGFAFMFGDGNSLIGWSFFALSDLPVVIENTVTGPTFFIFQLAFAGTAITIVSGSLVERTSFLSYALISVFMGLIIYPIFGRWVWGSQVNSGSQGWLEALGFYDFAGSTVVHSVGAWVALVGVSIVGPRLGRFDLDGTSRPFTPSNLSMTVLGTLILWFGWWGFNGGSALAFDSNVPRIILVTNLAGVAALFSSGLHAWATKPDSRVFSTVIGGALTGLVSVTAMADVVEPIGAVAVGLVAGIVHNLAGDFLEHLKIDDALGAIPVHGAGGVWGTLAVAIFTPAEVLEVWGRSRVDQLAAQVLGILVCIVFVGTLAYLAFKLIERTIGLRVSPTRELVGMDVFEEDPVHAADTEMLGDDELRELLS